MFGLSEEAEPTETVKPVKSVEPGRVEVPNEAVEPANVDKSEDLEVKADDPIETEAAELPGISVPSKLVGSAEVKVEPPTEVVMPAKVEPTPEIELLAKTELPSTVELPSVVVGLPA